MHAGKAAKKNTHIVKGNFLAGMNSYFEILADKK
jgi:hypothetical protein